MRTAKHERKSDMNLSQKIIAFAALLLASLGSAAHCRPTALASSRRPIKSFVFSDVSKYHPILKLPLAARASLSCSGSNDVYWL